MTDARVAPERVWLVDTESDGHIWTELAPLPGDENEIIAEYIRADLVERRVNAAVAAALEAAAQVAEHHYIPNPAYLGHTATEIRAIASDALRLHEARVIRELAERMDRECPYLRGAEPDNFTKTRGWVRAVDWLRAAARRREQHGN